RLGKLPAKGRNDVRDALVLEERRPHFDDVDASGQRRRGHSETLLQGGPIDRNLETETGSEALEHTVGRRVIHLRHLLRPGMIGSHYLEDGAGCQRTGGERARSVEARSPVDVPVLRVPTLPVATP